MDMNRCRGYYTKENGNDGIERMERVLLLVLSRERDFLVDFLVDRVFLVFVVPVFVPLFDMYMYPPFFREYFCLEFI